MLATPLMSDMLAAVVFVSDVSEIRWHFVNDDEMIWSTSIQFFYVISKYLEKYTL